jgi:hypothetical protein
MALVEDAKTFLAEDKHRIALHDLVASETKRTATLLADGQFRVQGVPWSNEEFLGRVTRYEGAVADLIRLQALLGYWAGPPLEAALSLAPRRLGDDVKPESGLDIWNALRWYPMFLLLYATGVAATAARRYENLRLILHAPVTHPDASRGRLPLVRAVVRGLREAGGQFKLLPGLEKRYTPLNDHVSALLQPVLDDLLLLGADFEAAFDDFEVLLALEHAHLYSSESSGGAWGPPGRFAWRFHSGDMTSPFHRILAEFERAGTAWAPIRGGMFQGSVDRFREIATPFGKMIASLGWY